MLVTLRHLTHSIDYQQDEECKEEEVRMNACQMQMLVAFVAHPQHNSPHKPIKAWGYGIEGRGLPYQFTTVCRKDQYAWQQLPSKS